VVLFVQNRYVIDDVALGNFSFKINTRLFFERIWFNSRCYKVDEFIVQTPSMQRLLKRRLLNLSPQLADKTLVKVLPFMEKIKSGSFASPPGNKHHKKFDFIYPASGESHKNHQNLIDAFIILAEEGHFPSLVLTLDVNKFNDTLKSIELARDTFKLNILNMGFLPHEELLGIYRSTRYLVYPSLYESFGIPLLEAKQAGLFIVAAELDYVRDSINPDQSFDPNSAVSIARAIKRSLGISEDLAVVLSADEFLSKLISPL
jgi:glycosyltransferase involved in cell wall biosynthesis